MTSFVACIGLHGVQKESELFNVLRSKTVTSAKEVMFSSAFVCLFVCLFAGLRINCSVYFYEFDGKVAHGPWKKV